MGVMKRIRALFGIEQRAVDPSWAAIAPGLGYAGAISAQAAENLSGVYACVNAIASALAYVPALVFRVDSEGNRVEVNDHPLSRLWRLGWNDVMTAPDGMEHMLASALLAGNGVVEIERDFAGTLTGLRFVPWQHVTCVYLGNGRLAYDVNDGRGNGRRLLMDDVIHLRDRTDDGLVGRSRLSRVPSVVTTAQAANEFASSFLANGAAPSGVIETTATPGPDKIADMREQFESGFTGARRAGRPLILHGGWIWKSVQISPEDAELLESRKFGVEEFCRLYQVPPPIVQDYSHNTFTNSETAGRWFAQFCLAAWARKIEAEFTRKLFPSDSGLTLELDLSGFLRGDPAARWNAHKIAIETQVLDADEVRQLEGWNKRAKAPEPVDDGGAGGIA